MDKAGWGEMPPQYDDSGKLATNDIYRDDYLHLWGEKVKNGGKGRGYTDKGGKFVYSWGMSTPNPPGAMTCYVCGAEYWSNKDCPNCPNETTFFKALLFWAMVLIIAFATIIHLLWEPLNLSWY